MNDIIRDIRIRLRRSMNGVVSDSMRKQGIVYKLNFGVSLPKIKEIASLYTKDTGLAESLWKEDVREMKILATLIQPPESFTKENAERWVNDIRHLEIAEQYSKNLLQELPFAAEKAADWISRDDEYVAVTGFLLISSLCIKGIQLSSPQAVILITRARKVMDAGVSRVQRAAVTALKRYGRQSTGQANAVLDAIADYPDSGFADKQEFYNDIKFDFEYYH